MNLECGIRNYFSARVLHILNISVTFVGEVLAASRRRERSFLCSKTWCAEPKASFIAKTIHFTEKMCPFLGQPQGSPLRIQQIQLQYKYGRARNVSNRASCLHDRNSEFRIPHSELNQVPNSALFFTFRRIELIFYGNNRKADTIKRRYPQAILQGLHARR